MFSLIDAVTKDVEINNLLLIDRVCFLIDVKKEVFKVYVDLEFKSGNGEALNCNELETLCVYLRSSYPLAGYKVINTLLKIESGILKNQPKSFVFPKTISDFLKETITNYELTEIEDKQKELVNIGEWVKDVSNEEIVARTVNTTFVKWNETVGKAYSYAFYKRKMKPLSVINVKPVQSLKRKIFSLLPRILQSMILKILRADQIHKPKVHKGFLEVFDSSHELHKIFDSLDENQMPFARETPVRASNINDVQIVDVMRNQLGSVVLFSGGGIVRQNTFDTVSKKFIHMHPGLLPEVRGADCFFWSVLVDGYPSCTAMYQNAGIDTGEILHEDSFELPKFDEKFIKNLRETNSLESFYEILYRSILDFYDPAMRSATLSGVLNKVSNAEEIDCLPVRNQSYSEGRNYHFMHPKLRNKLIDLMLKR